MTVGIVILICYMIVLLGIAVYASHRDQKNIKDFATGGGLGIFVLTLTFSATYHSAYAFMGAGGFVYSNGIGWWVNGLWTVLPGVLFWVWGRRLWFMGKKYGYMSVADYAADVYQSNTVGILVTAITMVFTVPYVAMQAIGCSYIFTAISGGKLSYTVGAVLFFVIMIILVWLGGMKGVAITDAAQGVFMFIGLLGGSLWVIRANFPSVAVAFEAAFANCPELFTMPGPNGVVTPQDWLSRWLVITFGMMMFPQVSLRFFAGKSLRVMKWSAVFSSIYLTFIYVLTPCVGFIGRLLMPDLAAADTVFPEMLLRYTPTVFAALVIAGALAAAMSTGDSQLHAASAMISTDIYKKYINKNADEKSMYNVARAGVLVVGLVSVVVALLRPGMLADLLNLANSGVGVLVPTIIGGMYWKRATKQGAIVSTVIGETMMVLMTFVFKVSPLGFSAGLWSMATALVVYVAVCLATKPQEHVGEVVDSINTFFELN
ncbi:sodium:solute symporter family protein [Agathobaculum desmolans]|uniref:sodium:solute symporter family protein n=1 Tax=Agathobaculum desmolans TaxID=39484 RepID=UPI00068A5429|nr:sodium:solute symporter family protein [Agathobaculum desmolans]